MTIAMCYVAPEGIVLGADSTASATPAAGHFHYFNHNQKVFEIGDGTTFGLLTWGLGGLPDVSFRTLAAQLGDDLEKTPAKSVGEVAQRWAELFWTKYSALLSGPVGRAQALSAKTPYDPDAAPPAENARTQAEEEEFRVLMNNFYVGFCIAGYCLPDREPQAYTLEAWPADKSAAKPVRVRNGPEFFAGQDFIIRSIIGFDRRLVSHVMHSGMWTGTEAELVTALSEFNLGVQTNLPIRDAIDFVYSSIHQTIKALKFSNLNQICGGPIEIAVITTDRKFRWVRHKDWQAAILEGESHEKPH